MNFLQKYQKYINNNPKGHWFKRKVYGWGWTPVTWQGWLVTLTYIGILLALALSLDEGSSRKEVTLIFILPFIILTIAFVRVVYRRGERPRWSWGFSDAEREDKEITKS